MKEVDVHLENFRQLNGAVPGWLQSCRTQALARFADLGFPTMQDEEWKYTSVAPIAKTAFRLPSGSLDSRAGEVVGRYGVALGSLLVFVNGCYSRELSSLHRLPPGTRVDSLAEVLKTDADFLEPHLTRYAEFDSRSFAALNTAFIQDGVVVYFPKGALVTEPVHALFVSIGGGQPIISHPRNLIVAEENSDATVIESYVGLDGETYCTNALTEIVLGPNANLAHYRLQREGTGAFHVGIVEARQASGSRFRSHAVSLGGALVRADINTVLDAEGSECSFDGLYLATGRQHVDHHTSIDHQKPHCSSRQLYKGVLDGKSTGVFNGKVYVRPHAQKSDAAQMNKNLLLSEDAVIDTKPQLEIFADDVKCSHGATIGRLDEDAVFYLRSRGIDEAEARRLLIFAFANELIHRMKIEPVRTQLELLLGSRFQQGLAIEASA